MLKKPVINTGDPRSVTGHVVSGAIASAIVAGAINYKKFQDGNMEKKQAVKDTLKKSAQGGIATGAAISAANHLGKGDWFKALSSMSVGMASLYAVEVVDSQLNKMALEKDNYLNGESTEAEHIADENSEGDIEADSEADSLVEKDTKQAEPMSPHTTENGA